ncbi:MAG: hypothetical protein IJ737_03735 [Ruminococcus sp.]|nr:hypothetical protein [Ruminococcus sp.]
MESLSKTSDAVLSRLTNAMKDSTGVVHPQSLLCALGSLAGYSCQRDVRDIYIKGRGLSEEDIFTVMNDRQGRRYFFGDILNAPLVNEERSVWALIGGGIKAAGGALPDVNDIFRYVSVKIGSEEFGRVRSTETGDTMQGYLKALRAPMLELASQGAGAGELHVVFGLALQRFIKLCRGSIDLSEAGRIAMESAVSMSKIDIRTL